MGSSEKIKVSSEEYANHAHTTCPILTCRSGQIEGGSVDVDGNVCTQEVACKECGASWTDVYKLIGYEGLQS